MASVTCGVRVKAAAVVVGLMLAGPDAQVVAAPMGAGLPSRAVVTPAVKTAAVVVGLILAGPHTQAVATSLGASLPSRAVVTPAVKAATPAQPSIDSLLSVLTANYNAILDRSVIKNLSWAINVLNSSFGRIYLFLGKLDWGTELKVNVYSGLLVQLQNLKPPGPLPAEWMQVRRDVNRAVFAWFIKEYKRLAVGIAPWLGEMGNWSLPPIAAAPTSSPPRGLLTTASRAGVIVPRISATASINTHSRHSIHSASSSVPTEEKVAPIRHSKSPTPTSRARHRPMARSPSHANT